MGNLMHASAVAIGGQCALFTGPSGSGKSALALELMALGATLVADDQTEISTRDGWPWAAAPARLAGMIEARGIGILAADFIPGAHVRLIVDLAKTTTDRLPLDHTTMLCDQAIPTLHKVESPHFPAAILQYLKGGKVVI